jgi:hypothetical protein
MANALFVIRPYNYSGLWVFDDDQPPRNRRNGQGGPLVREPFVAGIDTMIDRVVADLPNRDQFIAVFSAEPFPGAQIVLEWVRGDREDRTGEGNWYHWQETGMEGWLCPALFRYFETAPDRMYIQIKPAEGKRS